MAWGGWEVGVERGGLWAFVLCESQPSTSEGAEEMMGRRMVMRPLHWRVGWEVVVAAGGGDGGGGQGSCFDLVGDAAAFQVILIETELVLILQSF